MTGDSSDGGKSPMIMLAAIQYSDGDRFDRLISLIASRLKRRGYRVGGVIQSNVMPPGECRCDMLLEELTTGQVHRISQQLGPGALGCRLDTSIFENVAARVEASLLEGLDILVVNKFGKQEAEGRGLRDAIANAVTAGIPVLVGLNRAYVSAWCEFCGGQGQFIEADEAAVNAWLEGHLPEARARQRA
jgi:nucleoside-triphosphatase THEP1